MGTFLVILFAVIIGYILIKLWIRFVNWFMNPLIKRAEEREERLRRKFEEEQKNKKLR